MLCSSLYLQQYPFDLSFVMLLKSEQPCQPCQPYCYNSFVPTKWYFKNLVDQLCYVLRKWNFKNFAGSESWSFRWQATCHFGLTLIGLQLSHGGFIFALPNQEQVLPHPITIFLCKVGTSDADSWTLPSTFEFHSRRRMQERPSGKMDAD